MRKVDSNHPEIARIHELLPTLAHRLRARLECKYQQPMKLDRLIAIAQHAATGKSSDFTLVTAGPCLVGLSVVRPWWADKPILMEEFIIRYKSGNFADTIEELEREAKRLGCSSVAIGSLAMIRQESYGNYLKRKGFHEVARQYTKGVE